MLRTDEAGPAGKQGWSLSDKVSTMGRPADYSLYADVYFVDGTHQYGFVLPFDPQVVEWQQVHGVIHAPVAILRIELFCMLRWRQGAALFDDLSVATLDVGVCSVQSLAV